VADADRIKNVANRIIQTKKQGNQVVVIVSAMGDSTDELIELAKQVNPNPPKREMDMLVSTGEQVSISLLAMAIQGMGEKVLSLTGPQAGIIIGKKKYIDMMKKHPLARAFRVDKFTLAALEATLTSYLDINDAVKEIPTLNMIAISKEELYNKAKTLKAMLDDEHRSLACEIEECIDQVGGGSAPTDRLEGFGVSVRDEKISPEKLERKLRKAEIPIIVRINHDRLFLDVRTIKVSEFEEIVKGFEYALEGGQDA